jgi:hypothetical protein
MKPEERIKAVAEAIFKADFPDDQDLWDECEGDMKAIYNRMAKAALNAAGIEALVRKAARAGWDMGRSSSSDNVQYRDQDSDFIVQIVMREL